MDTATDCPGQNNRAKQGGQAAESLLLVGELALEAGCSIYAVQYFLRKKKVRHTRRIGKYRLFNHDVLKQLREYRADIDKRKRA